MVLAKQNKKISYKIRKIIHSQKPPKIYFTRMNQRAIIVFKTNNIFFNVCGRLRIKPYLYSTFYWVSCGSAKFSAMQYKGATKVTFLAHFAFGQFLKNKLRKMHFQSTTDMCLKGGTRYTNAFSRGFEADKKKLLLAMIDHVIIPLNGCRLPKKRRV